MKILIVTEGFFPGKKYGGPPVSVNNFCTLMTTYDCYIVTHNHDYHERFPYEGIEENVWIDRGGCQAMYVSDQAYRRPNFERIVREIEPDYLYLQGVFQQCVIPCLRIAKKYHIRVVIAPRGELCSGALKKKYKKIPYLFLLRISGLLEQVRYQATSREEADAVHSHLKVPYEDIYGITNIPSIPSQEYKRNEKRKGKADLVFLSRIHPKKNLEMALNCLFGIKGNVKFDIYGPIEDSLYWNRCQKVISQLPENIQVTYCGIVGHEEVHHILSKYDAMVFPTFSENYGHVIAESLLVGTVVIISDQTPWNRVGQFQAGWALPLERTEPFTDAVQSVVWWDEEEGAKRRDYARAYIEQEVRLDEVREEYHRLFEER